MVLKEFQLQCHWREHPFENIHSNIRIPSDQKDIAFASYYLLQVLHRKVSTDFICPVSMYGKPYILTLCPANTTQDPLRACWSKSHTIDHIKLSNIWIMQCCCNCPVVLGGFTMICNQASITPSINSSLLFILKIDRPKSKILSGVYLLLGRGTRQQMLRIRMVCMLYPHPSPFLALSYASIQVTTHQ